MIQHLFIVLMWILILIFFGGRGLIYLKVALLAGLGKTAPPLHFYQNYLEINNYKNMYMQDGY